MKRTAWIGLAVAVVLGLLGWMILTPSGEGEQEEQEIHTVGRRDISATVMAMGVVRPMVGAEVKVGSRVSGVRSSPRLTTPNSGPDSARTKPPWPKPRPSWRWPA